MYAYKVVGPERKVSERELFKGMILRYSITRGIVITPLVTGGGVGVGGRSEEKELFKANAVDVGAERDGGGGGGANVESGAFSVGVQGKNGGSQF